MQQQQRQQQQQHLLPKQQGSTLTRARSCAPFPSAAHRASSRAAIQLSQAWYQKGEQHQVRKLMDEHFEIDSLCEAAKGDAKAGLRLRLEGQVAVLGGSLRVLNDSVAAQAGRVDLMNKRMAEWSQQIRAESSQKFDDLELKVQHLLVDSKRVDRVQTHLSQHMNSMEDRQQSDRDQARFANMEARLDMLEKCLWESPQTTPTTEFTSSFSGKIAICERHQYVQQQQQPQQLQLQQPQGVEEANHALALVRSMEKPLSEAVAKIEGFALELGEVHTKLGAHDEQQRVLRTIAEGLSESIRSHGERLERGNWDRRLDLVQQSLQDESRRKSEHLERVEVLAKRTEFNEQSLEELRGELWESNRRLRSSPMYNTFDGSSKGPAGGEAIDMPWALQDCRERLVGHEQRLAVLEVELETLREEMRPGRLVATGASATRDTRHECLGRGGFLGHGDFPQNGDCLPLTHQQQHLATLGA